MKVNPLKWFFETKAMQKFYKKACDPKNADFFNNTLPTVETLVCTGFYMYNTQKQKDIPEEQRRVLQWQNVLNCVAGMALGSFLNHKVTNFANQLAPKVNKEICDVHKVTAGIKVLLPCIATALVMRVLAPTVTALISTRIEDRRRENKAKQLNTVA